MKTIVGYFDNYDKAQAMVEELVARCFGPETIQIGRAAGESDIEQKNEHWPFEMTVRGYYPAEAQAQSAFVAVSVREKDSAAMSHLMGHNGAFRIEERTAGRP